MFVKSVICSWLSQCFDSDYQRSSISGTIQNNSCKFKTIILFKMSNYKEIETMTEELAAMLIKKHAGRY